MCPVCLATATLLAGSVASTGGLAAIAFKRFGAKDAVDNRDKRTEGETENTIGFSQITLRKRSIDALE